jgi:hypothetical protein
MTWPAALPVLGRRGHHRAPRVAPQSRMARGTPGGGGPRVVLRERLFLGPCHATVIQWEQRWANRANCRALPQSPSWPLALAGRAFLGVVAHQGGDYDVRLRLPQGNCSVARALQSIVSLKVSRSWAGPSVWSGRAKNQVECDGLGIRTRHPGDQRFHSLLGYSDVAD